MIYLLNLLISVLLLYAVRKSKSAFLIIEGLLIIIWTILIGGQFGVGADYFAYLEMFDNLTLLDYYIEKGEYGFAYLVKICYYFGVEGQGVFIVISFICSILCIKFCNKVDPSNKHVYILIFLYITVSTLFHNQMNGVRQCFATFIASYAFANYINNKKIIYFIALIFIASTIHYSALFLYFLLPFTRLNLNRYFLFATLIISIAIGMLPMDNLISSIAIFIPKYVSYLDSDYFGNIDIIKKASKLIFVPLYILSLIHMNKMNLTNSERSLFVIGFISFCLRIAFLTSSLTNRLGYLLFLMSILPIYFFLRENKDKPIINVGVYLYIFFIYYIKVVIFPIGEYSYSFYLFK